MTAFQSCSDTSDAVEFFPAYYLYLKPVARFNISVQFPTMKRAGQAISHLEVMEKLKNLIAPEIFTTLKVAKSTLEFIRFEAEIESKPKLSSVMAALNSKVIRLTGFNDSLKIRVAEAKSTVPTRHMWDSFFHNAKNMNDRVPGERPDTLYITNIPCKWFVSRHDRNKGNNMPSEYILKKVFEIFGEIRFVDIPCNDPYHNKCKDSFSGIKTFTFGQEHIFECYVQYKEYISFVKAMDTLRGMKLLFNDGEVAFTANIKVDYDRTKHLSDASINRRQAEREKFQIEEKNAEKILMKETSVKESEHQKQKKKKDGLDGKTNRVLKKFKKKCKKDIHFKIIVEERKLLMAQRKLESIRLLDVILERVKKRKEQEIEKEKRRKKKHEDPQKEESDEESLRKRQAEVIAKRLQLEAEEQEIRQKLIMKYKTEQKEEMKLKKEEIMAAYDGQQQTEEIDLTLSDSPSVSDHSLSAKRKNWQHSHDNKSSADGEHCCHNHDCQKYGCRLQECYHQHFTQNFNQKRGFFPRRQRYYSNWQPRGRGTKFSQRYQGYRPRYTDYSVINMEYYRYFRKLAKLDDSKESHCDEDCSPFSMSSSYSKHSHTYSRSRSGSRGRSISCQRSRYSSRYHRSYSRSTSRHHSRRSRSVSRHHSRRSHSASRHHSRRTRSTSRHHSRRSRSTSRHHSRRSRSTSRHHSRRSRSTSRCHSRRSRSTSRHHSRRSCSTSQQHSRRSRSTSQCNSRRTRSTSRHHCRKSRSYSRSKSRNSYSHSRNHSRSQSHSKKTYSSSKLPSRKSSLSKNVDVKSEVSREKRSCSKFSSSRGHSCHSPKSISGVCYSPFRKSSISCNIPDTSLSSSRGLSESLETTVAKNIKVGSPKNTFSAIELEKIDVDLEGNTAAKYTVKKDDKTSDIHLEECDVGTKKYEDKTSKNGDDNSKKEHKTQHKKNKKHKKHKHKTHKSKKEKSE